MKRVRHIYAKASEYTVKVTLEVITGKNNSQTRPEFIRSMENFTEVFAMNTANTAGCPVYKVKVK